MMGVTVTHVKKNDLVQVMVGKERGKTGKILRVNQKKGRVLVEKLNMIKRHTKPTQKSAGGIVEAEGLISASNVLLYCDKCSAGVRTARKTLETGKKVRVCRECKTQLDK
ncbi:MAG: 50S ribosomal protein L24 [Proteobacteria bacterium]|jgi:large subunit ribosomal protein L24|nr:50S ribosomal protein L24 [Pseudomonadota bacterium]NBY20344.1 50S ribosomal protein L24 [bacterium]